MRKWRAVTARRPKYTDDTLGENLQAFLREPVRFSDDEPPAEPVFLPPSTPPDRVGMPHLEGGILYKLSTTALVIWKGDISNWHIPGRKDVIVAPANKRLTPGVGVNRAIHNAGGPKLTNGCVMVANMRRPDIKCLVGEAVMTRAYDLRARRIIHAVGPAYDGGLEAPALLQSAYEKSLKVAARAKMLKIAFPAISCCNFGYPLVEGAQLALMAVKNPPSPIKQVHFVLHNSETFVTWIHEANKMFCGTRT